VLAAGSHVRQTSGARGGCRNAGRREGNPTTVASGGGALKLTGDISEELAESRAAELAMLQEGSIATFVAVARHA